MVKKLHVRVQSHLGGLSIQNFHNGPSQAFELPSVVGRRGHFEQTKLAGGSVVLINTPKLNAKQKKRINKLGLPCPYQKHGQTKKYKTYHGLHIAAANKGAWTCTAK